jgi:diguanylate cyclase (GGDEF)-like protein
MNLALPSVGDVAAAIGLSAERFEQRKRFIALTSDEERLLQQLQPRMQAYSDQLIEAFYHHLMQFDAVADLLQHEATRVRLRDTQRRYFERLLSGHYDYDYALDRLAVGIAHERIGLKPEWYTGAFGSYLHHFSKALQRELADSPTQVSRVLTALNKLVLLDVTLALDAYSYAGQCAIVNARDDVQHLYDEQTRHIQKLAFYDSLTGLPNRNLLGEQVEQLLAIARREGRTLSLIYMDIINLKEINDTLGHEVGDALLKAVSLRLQQTIREMDLLGRPEQAAGGTLARITGDEFALACFVPDGDAVLSLVSRINKAFAEPFRIEGAEVTVRKRYGVVLAPHDGDSYEILLRHADIALHQAKARTDQVCFYDALLGLKIRERAYLARRLEAALVQGNGLELRFQPQVCLATGRLCGAEVLLRWFDAELGWVSPNQFIPLAEERGLIDMITRKVLKMAGHQRRVWQEQGLLVPGRIQIKLAVNVSARDLDDSRFANDLLLLLAEEGVSPSDFELELTETGLMRDPEDAINMLHHLKEKGFALAIDDFGTGHSSLNYLKDIDADLLKIDMSFVRNLDRDAANRAIVQTIIATAHIFGMKTLAEGIENEAIADELKRMGCDYGQGYCFARPLTATEFEQRWLSSQAADVMA